MGAESLRPRHRDAPPELERKVEITVVSSASHSKRGAVLRAALNTPTVWRS
jgi:hypothetical protein